MKRLLFWMLFAALPISASADSWLAERGDYYIHARIKLGYDTASGGLFSDTIGSQLWNEAVTVVLPVNRGLKKLTTITTTYHENIYTLDSTLLDIDAVWYDSAGTVKPLSYLPISQWGLASHTKTDDKTDESNKSRAVDDLTRATYYDYTDSLLIIYPTPSQNRIDTMTVMGWHRIADVDTVTVSGSIPEMYRPAILYHMVWNHAKSRKDGREEAYAKELNYALNRIGLKLTPGGEVVQDNN